MTSGEINRRLELFNKMTEAATDCFNEIESHRNGVTVNISRLTLEDRLETAANIIDYIHDKLEPVIKTIKEIEDGTDPDAS